MTVCTARRRGLPFAPAKGSKTGSRGKFPLDKPLFVACSAGYERCEASSVLRTDTLQRCLRRIFIAPALERRRANHHPCPRLKGGELWGKLSKYFTVCKTASSANRSPCRLAVPEKIIALLACSIFSTAAGAPPRCIRHWRRSAPHPLPLPRGGGGAVWANSFWFKF